MFYTIRFFIAFIIFGIVFTVVKRKVQQDKKIVFVLSMAVALYLLLVSTSVKVENLFFSFDSPEAAYEYGLEKQDSGNAEHILYGEHCALVINEEDKVLIPKSDDGWKLKRQNDLIAVAHQLTTDYVADVYRYRNTTDYFVCVEMLSDDKIELSDSVNSNFVYYAEFKEYWAQLSLYDEGYDLEIDGQKVLWANRRDVTKIAVALSVIVYVLFTLCTLRIVTQQIVLLTHNDLCRRWNETKKKVTDREVDDIKANVYNIRKVCMLLSKGLFSKKMRFMFNNSSLILAEISFMENDEEGFLRYIKSIRKHEEFEQKSFILALYYRAKNEQDQAREWYEQHKKCIEKSRQESKILGVLFEGEEKDEFLYSIVKEFTSPLNVRLLRDNELLPKC